jgi:predicted enzyme related to lactoylglutathione lyase
MNMPAQPSSFFWYELMTTDVAAAEAFYTAVVGWNSERFAGSEMEYIVIKAGDRGVGGIMELPEGAKSMGMPPAWVGYIYTADVDAATESLKKAGGQVHREPSDIPEVGRFSVVADPQGATFMFLQPSGEDQPPLPRTAQGGIGWHELYAGEWQSAFDFYAGQFGWTKSDAMDMGEMGTYQLFAVNGEQTGGMMTKPANIPVPVWLFYFNVDAVDAAAKRVTDNGGQVIMGPMEVPGGSWVLQASDPQGAMFALAAPGR